MNKVILCGRLTKDPEVRYSQGNEPMAIARYTLAVDRRRGRNNDPNEQSADFISIVAFGKAGEFAEKYLKKGTKMLITGRIQTGSYTNKDGVKVYTTEVVVEEQEFAESKNSSSNGGNFGGYNNAPSSAPANDPTPAAAGDGFMNIPDGIEEELPFN
jgi:single-strand DNA-binding protein